MTDTKESAGVLTIDYRRGRTSRIFHLVAGISLLALAVIIFFDGQSDVPNGEYAAFAAPFLIFMALASLAGAFIFISRAFDTISYQFDKAADEFCVSGRRYLFKRWSTTGMTSEITGFSQEVRETDDNTSSEIYLTFRRPGNGTETLRCGTRIFSEDNNIADIIERFLARKNDL